MANCFDINAIGALPTESYIVDFSKPRPKKNTNGPGANCDRFTISLIDGKGQRPANIKVKDMVLFGGVKSPDHRDFATITVSYAIEQGNPMSDGFMYMYNNGMRARAAAIDNKTVIVGTNVKLAMPIQTEMSAHKHQDEARAGTLALDKPILRIKIPFGADGLPTITIKDKTKSRKTPDGRTELQDLTVKVGNKYEPLNINNIHLALRAGATIDGIIDAAQFVLTPQWFSMPMQFQVMVVTPAPGFAMNADDLYDADEFANILDQAEVSEEPEVTVVTPVAMSDGLAEAQALASAPQPVVPSAAAVAMVAPTPVVSIPADMEVQFNDVVAPVVAPTTTTTTPDWANMSLEQQQQMMAQYQQMQQMQAVQQQSQ